MKLGLSGIVVMLLRCPSCCGRIASYTVRSIGLVEAKPFQIGTGLRENMRQPGSDKDCFGALFVGDAAVGEIAGKYFAGFELQRTHVRPEKFGVVQLCPLEPDAA